MQFWCDHWRLVLFVLWTVVTVIWAAGLGRLGVYAGWW